MTAPDKCDFCGVVFAPVLEDEWRSSDGESFTLRRSSASYIVADTSKGSVLMCEHCFDAHQHDRMTDEEKAEIHYQFGLEYRDAANPGKSLKCLKTSLQYHRSAKALAALGYAYDLGGDRQQAIQCYKEAIAIEPGNGMAVANLELLMRHEN